MKKPKYTLKLHKHRLTLMLKRDEPCRCCPAAKGFDGREFPWIMWSRDPWANNSCTICRAFVGLFPIIGGCPCTRLGKAEAMRRTKVALGMID